jgi:hypothetical protein
MICKKIDKRKGYCSPYAFKLEACPEFCREGFTGSMDKGHIDVIINYRKRTWRF